MLLEKRKEKREKNQKFSDINISVRKCSIWVDLEDLREIIFISSKLPVLIKCSVCFVSGGYEPPLTNVFTMQWFLTLFATCLPNQTVLKIWDSIFFEGSEIILRVSLAIWAKLGE